METDRFEIQRIPSTHLGVPTTYPFYPPLDNETIEKQLNISVMEDSDNLVTLS
jgi:hypothetical protein